MTAAYCSSVKVERAEARRIEAASSILPEGRCRIPFPDLRTNQAPTVLCPSQLDTPSPRRHGAHTRRLTADQEATTRALAGTKSLGSPFSLALAPKQFGL